MKIKLLFALLLVSMLGYAGSVPDSIARIAAVTKFYNLTGRTATLYSKAVVSNKVARIYNVKGGGWIWLRNEDKIAALVGYNNTGKFYKEFLTGHMPMVDIYKREIEYKDAAQYLKIDSNNEWKGLKAGIVKPRNFKATQTVAPLCQTTYNQDPYVNDSCPYNTVDKMLTETGCNSTGPVQIMRFWQWPPKGKGSHGYTDPLYGPQYVNFSNHTYNWAAMPLTNSKNAGLAQIMRDFGVAVNMQYGDLYQGGSGSFVISSDVGIGNPCAQDAFVRYFDYKSTIQGLRKSSYTNAQWDSLISIELNAARPIQYAGFDPSGGGHTWVCDGVDANNLKHMNWGWGGYGNGYFNLASLAVAGYNFSTANQMLIHIEPNGNIPPPTTCPSPILNPTTNITINSATISWAGTDSIYILKCNGKTVSITGNTYNLTGLPNTSVVNWSLTGICKGGLQSGTSTGSFSTLSLPCMPPTQQAITNITTATATISWLPDPSNTRSQVVLVANGTYKFIDATSPYIITGLTPLTGYEWGVVGWCGTTQGTYSTKAFKTLANTPPTCAITNYKLFKSASTGTFVFDSIQGATYSITLMSNGRVVATIRNSIVPKFIINGLHEGQLYTGTLSIKCGTVNAGMPLGFRY